MHKTLNWAGSEESFESIKKELSSTGYAMEVDDDKSLTVFAGVLRYDEFQRYRPDRRIIACIPLHGNICIDDRRVWLEKSKL